MNNRLTLSLLILLLFPMLVSNAQSRRASGTKPKLVLVQLSSESNRIDALTKAKRYREAEEVKRDATGVIRVMMKDFKDNFTELPVLYYMDTNMDAVRNQQFEGVLLDSTLTSVTSPITPGSKDYLIVYFGLPTTQPNNMRVVRDSLTQYSKVGEPSGKGLIVCNYKYQQLTYFYRVGYFNLFANSNNKLFMNKELKKYTFSSKHFNIEYFPLAKDFNNDIPEIFE